MDIGLTPLMEAYKNIDGTKEEFEALPEVQENMKFYQYMLG